MFYPHLSSQLKNAMDLLNDEAKIKNHEYFIVWLGVISTPKVFPSSTA